MKEGAHCSCREDDCVFSVGVRRVHGLFPPRHQRDGAGEMVPFLPGIRSNTRMAYDSHKNHSLMA